MNSCRLRAEHVAPVFKRANESRQASYDWVTENGANFMGQAMQAAGAMIQKQAGGRAAKAQKKAGE